MLKKMNNPYYFFDENLKSRFEINLENHKINHSNTLSNIIRNFSVIGIETRFINIFLEEMATIFARLINHYKFK